MLSLPLQWPVAICLLLFGYSEAAKVTNPQKVPKDAILLSQVQTLTVYGGKQTSSRRVSPVPQLQCVGPPNVCNLYSIDVMRCTNEGADYDAENIQWSCKASLPEEFKIGSTDVYCEGYASSDDPYVLKGSCGVEYRLLLTDKGEAKFGNRNSYNPSFDNAGSSGGAQFMKWLFIFTFVAVACIIVRSMYLQARQGPGQRPRRPPTNWGGFGGGGNDDDDPPPPYDPYPRSYGTAKKKAAPRTSNTTRGSSSRTETQQQQQQGWRPGFWTGTAAGAAAGYFAGNRGNSRTQPAQPPPQQQPSRGLFGGNTGGSSWATQPSTSSSSPPSYSNTRHESTGFGSTRRR